MVELLRRETGVRGYAGPMALFRTTPTAWSWEGDRRSDRSTREVIAW